MYVVAGPNGAGKTTFALRFLPSIARCKIFVNADFIARGLSPLDVDASAITSGKLFLEQINAHAVARSTFAFETTLSGLGHLRLLSRLRSSGYRVYIYFLWVPTVDLALRRVADRVQLGGHRVPSEVVRRRYRKGLVNLFDHYLAAADYCAVFDNSSADPVLVYEWSLHKGRIVCPDVFEQISKQRGGAW